ncbi:unnamed protein product [Cochlearia groenlandica]
MRKNRELKNFDFDETTLEFVSVLGRGGFGSVSLMRDSNFRLYAEKSSPLHLLKSLQKEHRIMLRFRNHPRIVQASSPNFHIDSNPQRCFIYMEYAPQGSLVNLISKFRGNPMPESMIGRITFMILQGLFALHTNGYVHCDIKPDNVLLFPSTNLGGFLDLKLADFGISKELWTNDSRSMCGGTRQYMPPESGSVRSVVGPCVDIWALGCVVIEMFGGKPKKMGDTYDWEVSRSVISPMANDFLRRCSEIPMRRATAAELLNHPFVAPRLMFVPPRPEMFMFPLVRVPSVTRHNPMQDHSTRQRQGQGGEVMKMVPNFQDLKI